MIIISIVLLGIASFFLRTKKNLNKFTIDFKRAYEIKKAIYEPKIILKDTISNKPFDLILLADRNRQTKTYTDDNGYRRFKNSNKLVHRWVMEKYINRKLSYKEVVHHIDGDKQNNKLNNLKLFANQEEHNQCHLDCLRNYGVWYEKIPEYSGKNFLQYAK